MDQKPKHVIELPHLKSRTPSSRSTSPEQATHLSSLSSLNISPLTQCLQTMRKHLHCIRAPSQSPINKSYRYQRRDSRLQKQRPGEQISICRSSQRSTIHPCTSRWLNLKSHQRYERHPAVAEIPAHFSQSHMCQSMSEFSLNQYIPSQSTSPLIKVIPG